MTNADKIRNMSDEELAEWIAKDFSCTTCGKIIGSCGLKQNITCFNHFKDWLNSESEE